MGALTGLAGTVRDLSHGQVRRPWFDVSPATGTDGLHLGEGKEVCWSNGMKKSAHSPQTKQGGPVGWSPEGDRRDAPAIGRISPDQLASRRKNY